MNEKTKIIFLVSVIVLLILGTTLVLLVNSNREKIGKPEALEMNRSEIPEITKIFGNFTIFRLPTKNIPINYDLKIHVDFENMSFSGEVWIKIRILEPTRKIRINSEELNITRVTVQNLEYLEIQKNYLEIGVSKEVGKMEEIDLRIEYFAKFRDDSRGFYETPYFDEENRPKKAVVTQMEPDTARFAVPCFDEPEFKATWKIRIIHPIGTSAISNQDLAQEARPFSEGFQISEFQETPKMPSYLLAIFISDFEYVEGFTDNSRIRVRIWSRPEEVQHLNLALNTIISILDKFEKDFGVSYPMKKLDMIEVAVLDAGAMENWGLIVYAEGMLSYNEKMDTLQGKRTLRTIIAHELAHQWFGNLVTLEWWTSLWLNEGFANMMELYGADVAAGGIYDSSNRLLYESQNTAFQYEYASVQHPQMKIHPLNFEITENDDDIHDFFNPISYDKGASILSMIRKVIGKSVFDEGIRSYLKSNEYKNVIDEDLYEHLQKSYDIQIKNNSELLNIRKFAKSWTDRTLFPVINVSSIGENQVTINQLYFALDEDETPILIKNDSNFWEIPIFYQKDNEDITHFVWLNNTPLTIDAKNIVLNIDSDSYYRVSYDESTWNFISQKLNENHKRFSIGTRYRLVEDAMLFGKETREIEDYLLKETDHIVILAYLNQLERDSNGDRIEKFEKSRNYGNLWEFVKENYAKDEKVQDVEIAYRILKIKCQFKNCLPDAQKYIDQLKTCPKTSQISKCSTVPAQLREIVYCIGQSYDVDFRNLVQEWKLIERRASELDYFNDYISCEGFAELEEYQRKSAKNHRESTEFEDFMRKLKKRRYF